MDNSEPVPPVTQDPGVTQQAEQTEVKMSPIKMTPMLKTLLILLAVLFILVVVVLLAFPAAPPQSTGIQPSPLASPEAQVSPLTRTVSEYAQTDQFKAFESKLGTTKNQQDGLDLTEPKLAFPLLEMRVNYQK